MSAALVKELRERTGLGLMECKKALSEASGDIDAAIEALRKSSGMKAAKKAGRTAADGVVAIQTADDGSFAAMVEINSETDFVARDDNFLNFVRSLYRNDTVGRRSTGLLGRLHATGLAKRLNRRVDITTRLRERFLTLHQTQSGPLAQFLNQCRRHVFSS